MKKTGSWKNKIFSNVRFQVSNCKLLFTAFLGILLFSSSPVCSQEKPVIRKISVIAQEYKIKAGFIYNFARYTQWPENVFEGSDAIVLCIVSDDNHTGSLLTLNNRRMGKRKIRVKKMDKNRDRTVCKKTRTVKISDISKLKKLSVELIPLKKNRPKFPDADRRGKKGNPTASENRRDRKDDDADRRGKKGNPTASENKRDRKDDDADRRGKKGNPTASENKRDRKDDDADRRGKKGNPTASENRRDRKDDDAEHRIPDCLRDNQNKKNNFKYAEDCHVLFFSSKDRAFIQEKLDMLKNQNILTVGETEGFIEMGGMINFFEEEQHLRFTVNQCAAAAAGLKLSSQLLKSADIEGLCK